MINEDVIFDSNKNYNCYYVYQQVDKEKVYHEDALERICFTYAYLVQKKNFKLDLQQKLEKKSYGMDTNIYYFINQKKG